MGRKLLTVALCVVTVFLLAAIVFAMHDGGTTDAWAVVFWGVLDLVLAAIWLSRQLKDQRRVTDR